MDFRLTYHGPLLAETNRDGSVKRSRAEHKQMIRKKLHLQLKRLWDVSPALRYDAKRDNPQPGTYEFGRLGPNNTIEKIGERFAMFGYNFVPLATRELGLFCDIDVLFLRHGEPGGIISRTGDIDNRLKTLFDALTMPRNADQVGPWKSPDDTEKPFFCLLEDDSVISKASVETETLLESLSDQPDPNDARVIITVRLRPAYFSAFNLGFLA